MKRKSVFEENNNIRKKMTRMAELDYESNKSIVVASGEDVKQSLERIFNYKLSDKKAKSNFLKSAAKETLEIDEKGVCTMLNFSVGSYFEAVLPTINEWVAGNREVNVDNIKILEVLPSYDENNKHLETIIKFCVNNNKVTVTFYNTTQRVKIEGRGYAEFGRNVLIPLFRNKILNTPPGKIEQYNKDVIAALSGKRKVVSRPVRSVRYKSTAKVPCSKCEITFLSNSQLIKHKSTKHVSNVNSLDSNVQCLPLVDDISLLDLTDIEIGGKTSEEVTLDETCTVPDNQIVVRAEIVKEDLKSEKCEYSAKKKNYLKPHMLSNHGMNVLMDAKSPPLETFNMDRIEELTCRTSI